MNEAVTLFQFLYSPYNEKIRWALDIKNIAHQRQSLLPGPHMGVVKRLTGKTTTPVLKIGDRVINESAAILAEIEKRWPEPALMPLAPEEMARTREIETLFDENYTPRMRRVLLSVMLQYKLYFAAVFGADKHPAARFLYGTSLWLAAPLVRKGNGIKGQASVQDGIKAVDEAMDWVAANVQADGYLLGGRFSHADLVVAAHLAPFAQPHHPDTLMPQPPPKRMKLLLSRWENHAGAKWVRQIYRQHRPQPRAL